MHMGSAKHRFWAFGAWLVAFLPTFRPITEFSIPRGVGVTVLVLSWVITVYTLWQMVEMHEMVPGKRFDRYHELGQHAFGDRLGLWIVVPQQLVVEVGVNIVYMVTGGTSLQKFHDGLVCGDAAADEPRSSGDEHVRHGIQTSSTPRKYSIVRSRPGRSEIVGSQPSSRRARSMLG